MRAKLAEPLLCVMDTGKVPNQQMAKLQIIIIIIIIIIIKNFIIIIFVKTLFHHSSVLIVDTTI